MKLKLLTILLLVTLLLCPVRAGDEPPEEVKPMEPLGGGPAGWNPWPMIIIGGVSTLIILYLSLVYLARRKGA